MNSYKLFSIGLLISVTLSATTCSNECPREDLKLDSGSRSWLPLKGKTQLVFTTQSGVATSFVLKVVDTLQAYSKLVDCSGNYFYEYINTDLYLNTARTDSIHCAMASASHLTLIAYSDNKYSMGYGSLLSPSSSASSKTRYASLKIGNRTYSDVILATSLFGDGNTVDSIYLAYNYGVVGFNYHKKKYFLR